MSEVKVMEMADETEETIAFECDLPQAPEKVWRALTVPELVAAWLMPNDLVPEQGARFTLNGPPEEGGDVACEVLDIEPERLIRYSWRDEEARRLDLDSTVTFELARSAVGGTHLRIVHSGLQRAGSRVSTVMSAANANQPRMMLRAA
ncbi:SRPBCC family protein [Mesorhizobium sp. ZC-5]|uniref:SRPBCC family protein n=1 Tax=Mesorhizobium sp. ZC-5 TaxID=2986066 RepID=UPI0021E7D860|nr:SRPBCC domain-containing protein [Mesorhizobium sp. ZC-5]MCV3240539.1 SRPBCC domain-containing protein [Mesorhizobium sp. ZC-5]